jgi:hypothetical protein
VKFLYLQPSYMYTCIEMNLALLRDEVRILIFDDPAEL